MTDTRERARIALQRTTPCTHDMVGDEDICDGCKCEWEKSLIDRMVAFASSEAALARKDERFKCAGIAEDVRLAAEARMDFGRADAARKIFNAIHERNLAETGG